jgi:hypothetical protein
MRLAIDPTEPFFDMMYAPFAFYCDALFDPLCGITCRMW